MAFRYAPLNLAAKRHGELIRRTRLGLGLTQKELAAQFGIWRETLNRIENGRFNVNGRKFLLFNERMRIWAEMNKKGNKRKLKYINSGKRVYHMKGPDNPEPWISPNDRFWTKIKEKNERKDT